MDKSISSGLKTWFIVHMIVGAVFGVLFLLLPEMWGNLIGWPAKDPLIFRLFGAAIWGLTASSWFAYKETAWDKVKIVVQMEMVWLILGALVMLHGLFLGGAPALGGWLYFVVLGGLAAGFSYFYSRA
jgi:hypothetical protein